MTAGQQAPEKMIFQLTLRRRGVSERGISDLGQELLEVVDARPLHAYVVLSNVASIRVLEKCGFVKVGEHAGDDGIEELLLELRA